MCRGEALRCLSWNYIITNICLQFLPWADPLPPPVPVGPGEHFAWPKYLWNCMGQAPVGSSAMRVFFHFCRLSKEWFKVFADLVPSDAHHEGTVPGSAQFRKAQKLNHISGSGMVSLWFQESCFAAVCLLWGMEGNDAYQLHKYFVIINIWRWKATWFCNRIFGYVSADWRQEEQ